MKSIWLASVCVLGLAGAAHAQDAATTPGTPGSTTAGEAGQSGDTATAQAAEAAEVNDNEEIIVTATKRAQALSDVPIAVSAVSAETLANTGATDIRQLNQVSPSLLVSSTSSESGGGVARIRGIGTVGDNPGLESSVATFIDGVYRSRSGVGLSELGEIERIEVLRGPQGTLFGRNASAGLINVITRGPQYEIGGGAEATYGNYDFLRIAGSITGPIVADKIAARIDAVYSERDGYLKDALSDRRFNDRDRYLVRGQLLFEPNSDISIRIIGDYADRREQCCAAVYLPFQTATAVRDPNNPNNATNITGVTVSPNNSVVNALRSLGGFTSDDTYARVASVTPGRDYNSDVRDWGVSGELTWDLGGINLTSITAYRDWRYIRGQDADYNSLDILERDGWDQSFRTFSQEARLQGTIFQDKLDWLIGGYFANEDLDLQDNLKYGTDYDRYTQTLTGVNFAALGPTFNGILSNPALALSPEVRANVVALVPASLTFAGRGIVEDRYAQNSRNYAFFTHNVFNLTDALAVTIGARYTNERKKFSSSLRNDNVGCTAIRSSIGQLRALAAANTPPTGTAPTPTQAETARGATTAANTLTALSGLPCVISSTVDGDYDSRRQESEWTGTGVLSYKFTDDLLTYASWSHGYKAGGFNLDRSALSSTAPNPTNDLQFDPEEVNALEVGLKLSLPDFRLNIAAFRQTFSGFQLNTFNGINFIVENVQACNDDLGGADTDFAPLVANPAATGACGGKTRAGVRSQGVEIEASIFPADDLTVNIGGTYADTRYRENLVGIGGRPLAPPLFNIPDSRVSNAPEYVVTGGITYNPEIGGSGMRALAYADFRYQSEINTGSDKFPEKDEEGTVIVNARLGIQGPDKRWSIEGWAQNLFDVDYQQVGFNVPLQGSGTIAQTVRGGNAATQLFGVFPAEPRTYGVTVRTRF